MKERLIAVKNAIGRFNDKREQNSVRFKMTNIIMTVLFPVFIVCMAEINQAKYPSKFIVFAAARPTVILFNIMIASLIFYGLMLLFKRGWLAMVVQSFIYMALSITELFKYNTNGNHLIMIDMKLGKSIKSLTSFAYIKITPMLVTYVLIVLAFLVAAFWFNPKFKFKLSKRIAPALACLAACIGVVTVPAVSTRVYALFDIDTTESSNTFKLNEKFDNNSFLAFFCQTASESLANKLVEPANYNADKVDELTAVDADSSDTEFEKPNVIMIMSESFADFRRFSDKIDIDSSAYDGFDKACAEGYKGTAIVPTFASYTVRTEFELNLGLPVRSLNDPNMPQRMLLNRAQPTIASYYKSWGYQTAYVHPFMSSFYSRSRVYANFDFDRMIFDEDFTVPMEYYGTYTDDKTVFNQIEQLIKESDEPLFTHATTMQNHQPYDQGEDPDDEIGNYIQWVGHSCDDLTEFLDNLKKIDEPTLVFFIGDHYPSLRGENSIYDQIGMNSETCSVLYEQPFLLWSNYDQDFSSMPDYEFSTFYMPYVIMDLLGAPKDSFVQTMLDEMQTTPVYSTNYDDSVGRDERLDILTYDRILGDIVSESAIPEDEIVKAEDVEDY